MQQVFSPVLWQDSVEWLIAAGVDTFVEIGPGSVLAGLIRKIDKTVKVVNINSLESAKAGW
ncbi:Malonyl CoA-acyl carrier protein transacylase [compost metagenome]